MAKIPAMFHFAETKSLSFECALKLCLENEDCKPNCVLKIDDPAGEDPELVSKLLRSNTLDDDLASSGLAPSSGRKNVASTLIHVVGELEPPTTPLSQTQCKPN